MAAHIDPAKDGSIIINVLLQEPIALHILSSEKAGLLIEHHIKKGTAYCLCCPAGNAKASSCTTKYCPHHKLKHEIECAHSTTCSSTHKPCSLTTFYPPRLSDRLAIVFHFYENPTPANEMEIVSEHNEVCEICTICSIFHL